MEAAKTVETTYTLTMDERELGFLIYGLSRSDGAFMEKIMNVLIAARDARQ